MGKKKKYLELNEIEFKNINRIDVVWLEHQLLLRKAKGDRKIEMCCVNGKIYVRAFKPVKNSPVLNYFSVAVEGWVNEWP